MSYVDGFIIIVPNDKTEEYMEMAQQGRDAWMKHGAVSYFECRGDDMRPQEMGDERTRTFPEMAGARADETVWFSYITFESREHRDEVNAKVFAEMSEQMQGAEDMPVQLDMTRMAYGGFQVEVQG